jgi:hypothetical protein
MDMGEVVITLTEAQEDTLRGYLGEILATDSNQDIQDIYEMLTKGL